MRAWLTLLFLLATPVLLAPPCLLGLAAPAAAEDGPAARPGTANQVIAKQVITRQVEAFGRDDAPTAYAQAAPAIQDLFPNPDLFLGMVRNQYRPVYRHRSFVFGEARDTGDASVMQSVAIQDEYGVDWTAEYSLVRGADGQWRITGCRLIKAPGTSA